MATPPNVSAKFNGIDFADNGFFLSQNGISGRGLPSIRLNQREVAGIDGVVDFGPQYGPRRITMTGVVWSSSSHADLISKLESLKQLFAHFSDEIYEGGRLGPNSRTGVLEFGDQTDRYYRAVYDGTFQINSVGPWRVTQMVEVTVAFYCPDPYAYTKAVRTTLHASSVAGGSHALIDNAGTAIMWPRLSLRALSANITVFTMKNIGIIK